MLIWQDPELSFIIPSIRTYFAYIQFPQAFVLPSKWQGVIIIINNNIIYICSMIYNVFSHMLSHLILQHYTIGMSNIQKSFNYHPVVVKSILHAKNGFYILKSLLKKENVKQNTVHKVWNIYYLTF